MAADKSSEKRRPGGAADAAARPALTAHTSLEEFHNHYRYMSELVAFCREVDLPTSGSKQQLVERIEAFLGRRNASAAATAARRARPKPPARTGPITRDTEVTDSFKSDAETRAFFTAEIGPKFHFSAHVQQFRRDKRARGERLTYGDLVDEWLAEQERRKDKHYKSRIAGVWQYNQFIRDFWADTPANAGKTMADAARAWVAVRDHEGPQTYAEYRRRHPAEAAAPKPRARRPSGGEAAK